MLEDMRKYVRAGLEALASQGGDDAAGALVSRASGLAEQFSAFASGFLEWSAEARASLLQEVKDLVARQIEAMGVATKDDVETLRKRIDRLEARGAEKTPARRTSTARAARSSAAAQRSGGAGASRKSAAGKKGSTTSSRPRRSKPAPE